MPFRKKKKQDGWERISMTPREKAAAAAAAAREAASDRAIRVLAREKKKEAARQDLVDRAEAIKERARKREDDRKAAAKREAARQAREKRTREPEHQARCTCKKPQLDGSGKCRRCRKVPASRRRGLFGLCLVRHRTAVRTARS